MMMFCSQIGMLSIDGWWAGRGYILNRIEFEKCVRNIFDSLMLRSTACSGHLVQITIRHLRYSRAVRGNRI